MACLAKLKSAIAVYSDTYRRSDVTQLEEGKIYGLDKDIEIRSTLPTSYWPETWSLSHRRGIYAIFSHEKLLYIGKASQKALGYRLSSYFKTDNNKCVVAPNHTWSSQPTHVVTWAVPENMFFEASALEEFLIDYFKDELPDNTVGKSA
nr:GIY-YIG nuclease family protein [Moritella viscosa]SHO17593.1 Putative uncharacterized protein [Moritella viscosa]